MLVLLAGIFVIHIATVIMLFVCTIANVSRDHPGWDMLQQYPALYRADRGTGGWVLRFIGEEHQFTFMSTYEAVMGVLRKEKGNGGSAGGSLWLLPLQLPNPRPSSTSTLLIHESAMRQGRWAADSSEEVFIISSGGQALAQLDARSPMPVAVGGAAPDGNPSKGGQPGTPRPPGKPGARVTPGGSVGAARQGSPRAPPPPTGTDFGGPLTPASLACSPHRALPPPRTSRGRKWWEWFPPNHGNRFPRCSAWTKCLLLWNPAASPASFGCSIACEHMLTFSALCLAALGLLLLHYGLVWQWATGARKPPSLLMQLFHSVSGLDGGFFHLRTGLIGTLATVQPDLWAAASQQQWRG